MGKIALYLVVILASTAMGVAIGTLLIRFRRKRWQWLIDLLLFSPFLLWLVLPVRCLPHKCMSVLVLMSMLMEILAMIVQHNNARRRSPIKERILAAAEWHFGLKAGSLTIDSNIEKTAYKPNHWEVPEV